MKNSSVQDVLKTFGEGGLVLIHDGLDSDNKAHLITSAEKITEESYKALKRVGFQTIHVALEASRLIDLGFKASFEDNSYQVVNTVSVDAKDNEAENVLLSELKTIAKLVDPHSSILDFKQPGTEYITQAA